MQNNYLRDQTIALSLTVVTCLVLIGIIWAEITLLNQIIGEKIALTIRPADILIGLTIYLKTAIDFGIFIGRLMAKNPGLKGRIGIEIGSAAGNGVGTMAIILVWAFFKEVDWLLALMVIIASLVLLRLAQDTLVHAENKKLHPWFEAFTNYFEKFLNAVNGWIKPLLSRLVPSHSLKVEKKKTFAGLILMAFTVPFILGLDDFAGYVPLFDVINVFGFAIGVLVGHMILNIALYISPDKTIKIVKNPVISVVGSVFFVLLAAWGLIEAFKLLFLHH
jgi:hypothetical protein